MRPNIAKRFIVGVAVSWAVLLVFMHERLLKHNQEREKAAARLLSGYMLRIYCGEEVSILRDRVCIKRFKSVIVNWIKDKCFGEFGVSSAVDIDCSVYQYLVFVERICPVPANAALLFTSSVLSQNVFQELVPRVMPPQNFTSLHDKLEQCGKSCQWMRARVNTTQESWINTARELWKKQSRKEFQKGKATTLNIDQPEVPAEVPRRRRLRILLHMGLLTKEFGLNFGEAAMAGGPLGELVQWADLMGALHALGHEVALSWTPERLRQVLLPNQNRTQSCQPTRTVDLVFTDLTGLEQVREILGSLFHYRCLIRVLDVYGTDPEFNHPLFNPDKDKQRSWGGKGLNPGQFFTHFPHSPDNSFLGFVVQKHEAETDVAKRRSAIIYGKQISSLSRRSAKQKYLDKIHEYYEEMHATMWMKDDDDVSALPPYVINHKHLDQKAFLALLKSSTLFIGLGKPIEGPAALEAIANGVIFLNPKFATPRLVAGGKPTNRKLTSQNPYAEKIGEPYVYTLDIGDVNRLDEILKKIEQRKEKPAPFVPYEFTFQGFLERVDLYVQHQDFCDEPIRYQVGTRLIWAHERARWPPLSLLELKLSEVSESCTSACDRHELICERTYFADINAVESFRSLDRACSVHRRVIPREELENFRGRRKKEHDRFDTPCYAPSIRESTGECMTQDDDLLFSCACTPPGDTVRLCPCRKSGKDQTFLFPE